MPERLPDGQLPVFPPEDTGSTTVTAAAGVVAETEVCSIQCKNALQPWLVFIGNAVDPALIGQILMSIKVDGQYLYPYTPTKGQWAPPENPDREIPAFKLPQNAKVQAIYSALAGNPGGNVTARLRILYTPIRNPGGY